MPTWGIQEVWRCCLLVTLRKQWKPTFPPLVPEGSNLRWLSRGLRVCAGEKINLKMWRSPLYLLDTPLVTLYCLSSVISVHFLQTVPSHVIRVDCFKDWEGARLLRSLVGVTGWTWVWTWQVRAETNQLSFVPGLLGGGGGFRTQLYSVPTPFPQTHHTSARSDTRAHTLVLYPQWSLSVPQPPLHDLHLATLLSQGIWRDANLVHDRVIALGTYPANPLWPPASTPPPPPPPPV